MFKVVEIATGEIHTVYGMNGTYFLVYDDKNHWYYIDMDICRPVEE